jgi:nucleoside-diphosphate-sugar epimerase
MRARVPERVVLVTGGTGAVGPAVVRALQAAGYSVRILVRHPPPEDLLPPGVDIRVGDVCDGQTVRAAVAGARVVVHLAALLHQYEDAAGEDRHYERINVGGTENVVRAAIAENVERVVFLSTISVYGPTSGQIVDERTNPRPDTAYGRTKLAAEQVVLAAMSGGSRIGTVLRAAAVYGSGVKGNYRRLALQIAKRRFVPIGPGVNRRTLVHHRDLAEAVVLAAEHPAAAGALFNVTDGRIHTLAEIVAAIYRSVGRRPPRARVPLGVARAAVSFCERSCRLIRVRSPLTRSLLEKYTEDTAVDGALIRRVLGFGPGVDLDTGWRETVGTFGDVIPQSSAAAMHPTEDR